MRWRVDMQALCVHANTRTIMLHGTYWNTDNVQVMSTCISEEENRGSVWYVINVCDHIVESNVIAD